MKEQKDCNQQHTDHHHIHPVTENLKVALILNSTFTVIEIIGGILTNSIAIMSDAVHDFGDTIAIASALYFEKYAEKGRDKYYSYGYKRFSPLSALITSAILLAGSVIIIYETIPRLIHPEAVEAKGMILLAILGVLMNGLAVLKMKKGNDSVNQRAVMLHLMEDALGWIAVLIGSIIMFFVDLPIIDPILSLCIAAYILWNVVKNLKGIFRIFLQAIPKGVDFEHIKGHFMEIAHVKNAHDFHSWTLDGSYHIFTMHLIVSDQASKTDIIEIKKQVRAVFAHEKIKHYTIEIEYESEYCVFDNQKKPC